MLFPFFFAKYILSSHDNYDLKWGPFSPYPSRNVYDWASTCYWSRRQQCAFLADDAGEYTRP